MIPLDAEAANDAAPLAVANDNAAPLAANDNDAAPPAEHPATIPAPAPRACPLHCRCGREIEGARSRCGDCAARHADTQRSRIARRVQMGRCIACPERATDGRFCRTHAFAETARRRAGDASLGEAIAATWEAQGGRCAYTGELLVLGDNASLDHIIPVSRGGTNRPDNLQWVSSRINRMKSDCTHGEFLAVCALVLARAHAPALASLQLARRA